jgi:hypothetical protein
MIGTSKTTRVGQDISFPRSTVFPHDPTFDMFRRARYRRTSGKPYGVAGARVREPELGDIADTIGGGEERVGPEGPTFPGGGRFVPPPPFPSGTPGPSQPTDLDRALALGRTALGGARQVGRLVDLVMPPDLGSQPTTPGFADQRAGERADFTGALPPPGGATQTTASGLPSGGELGVDFDLGDVDERLQWPLPGTVGSGSGTGSGLPSGGELGLDFDLGYLWRASSGTRPGAAGTGRTC